MRTTTIIHIAVASLWIGSGLLSGIRLAILGSEDQALSAQRGRTAQEAHAIAREHAQVRAALEIAASRVRIESAVRELGLPIAAPVTVAQR